MYQIKGNLFYCSNFPDQSTRSAHGGGGWVHFLLPPASDDVRLLAVYRQTVQSGHQDNQGGGGGANLGPHALPQEANLLCARWSVY